MFQMVEGIECNKQQASCMAAGRVTVRTVVNSFCCSWLLQTISICSASKLMTMLPKPCKFQHHAVTVL